MAKIWQRDGIKLTFLPSGKIGIEVDIGAATDAHELDVVGSVRVYEVDVPRLAENVVAEAGRVARRIRKAVKK